MEFLRRASNPWGQDVLIGGVLGSHVGRAFGGRPFPDWPRCMGPDEIS